MHFYIFPSIHNRNTNPFQPVHDACGDRGRARHEAALALYGGYMYELVSSKELADPRNGLLPAKPVWITLDSLKHRNNSDRSLSLQRSVIEPNANTENVRSVKRTKRKFEVDSEGEITVGSEESPFAHDE